MVRGTSGERRGAGSVRARKVVKGRERWRNVDLLGREEGAVGSSRGSPGVVVAGGCEGAMSQCKLCTGRDVQGWEGVAIEKRSGSIPGLVRVGLRRERRETGERRLKYS